MMGVAQQERTDMRADPRTVGELFGSVSDGLARLFRAEIELAKTEMTQKASSMGKDVAMIAGGGVIAYAGFLCVVAALVLLIGRLIPVWLSALLVGLAVIGGGYFLINAGLTALKKTEVAPANTIETMKENTRWAKEQVT